MMKDECSGEVMTGFVGLRAKLYATKMHDEKESKKCKGVKKAVVKRNITFANYEETLFSNTPQMRKMNVIRSHKHTIYTEEINKIALSSANDKRIILKDGIHTLRTLFFNITPPKLIKNRSFRLLKFLI